MKEMTGQGVKQFDNWKLSVTFSWNGQRHIIISDGELVIVFKTFDSHSKDIVEFKMSLEPVAVEYPEEHIGLLTFNNKTPPASLNNEVDEETGEDSEVSLDKELGEEGVYLYRCDPDGDETFFEGSSNDDNGLTKSAKYCTQYEWTPNLNRTIELRKGFIFGNTKMKRDAVKRYAIHEGFTLKKNKMTATDTLVTCKNEACDWRLHALYLPNGMIYMIKSTNARWVASVIQTTNHSNPTIVAKVLGVMNIPFTKLRRLF
ncbi:hypothetical protein ACOSQ2_010816 [Xanthoceras sorbifolium]